VVALTPPVYYEVGSFECSGLEVA